MSISRLCVPLYFYGCPENFVHFKPSSSFVIILVAWVSLQALVLQLQARYGPTFFIPKRFLKEKYDYYRPYSFLDKTKPMSDAIGIEASASNNNNDHDIDDDDEDDDADAITCVICLHKVPPSSELIPANMSLMITPCNHLFHSSCLKGWLAFKMECPTCRRPLPPI